ncbi:MAG: ATP-binding protein [Streptosporangiaceae bacterium]
MAEILFAVLVVVVAVLMAVDVARTPSEIPFRPAGWQAPDAGRAFTGSQIGAGVTEFRSEPAAPGIPPAARDAAARDAAARDAAPPRPPEAAGPSAGAPEPARTVESAVGPRSSRALKDWRVSSRLWLMVGIAAVAGGVVAYCAARIAGDLSSASFTSPVDSVRHGAITSAIGFGVALVIVLVLAAWFAIAVARSVLRPLGRLRAGVVELPEVVRRIGEGRSQGRLPDVKPVDVDSADDLGEVARAFDQMRRETLRMAANEAAVRDTLSTMFMNLSHRSQSLVERQIRLIEGMEQAEQDPGRLASLAKMDRIAARMHRSSQNLLVLAGHEVPNRWNQPVALGGVIRAAMSEIEDHERVSLSGQPDIAVRGPAVNDVAHLLAELTENATSFSAGDMPVDVSSKLLTTGGALIEITDRGIGMAPKDMAYANWQLENAQAPDVNVPKWMGLFVVARLAARHGIRVRLQPAEFGGLTSLVWLPDDILTRSGATASPRLSEAAAAAPEPAAAGSMTEAAVDPRYVAAGHRAPPVTATEFAAQGEGARGGSPDWQLAGTAIQPPDPAWAAAVSRPLQTGTSNGGTVLGPPDPSSSGPHEAHGLPLSATPLDTPAPAGQASPDVIVPPAERHADHRRLPIFDEMESRWFGAGWTAPGRTAPGGGWTSPADQGWQAARAADVPTSAGSTPEGLPRRTPAANLIPGAIPGTPPSAPPTRSAAEVRDRLTGFQRGVSEGRAAAGEAANQGEDDQA